ncbi:MAG: hypothetical protein IPJ04_09655 [Candidatus Eisenbacteria bacterium]|jgi:flagellar basal body rod protein FlgG|nr:hypothetical protein [Candidatus Eisenbacteria bacterium]
MIRPMSATSSALLGMQASQRQMERAADTISRFGLDVSAYVPENATPEERAAAEAASQAQAQRAEDDFLGAMVDMITAQRAFSAQLRVLETANEMTGEAIDIGRHEG